MNSRLVLALTVFLIPCPSWSQTSWYVANSSWSACIESNGPAEKIQNLRDFGVAYDVKDHTDSSGQIAKVDVDAFTNRYSSQYSRTTFFRSKHACEADMKAYNSLDKYK